MLERIAAALIGNGCKKITKQTGNEITVSGAKVGIGTFTVDIGKFSNQIKEINKVSQNTISLDNTQYLLCDAIRTMDLTSTVKDICNRTRLQIIIAYSQLEQILNSLSVTVTDELKQQLSDWIVYTSEMNKNAIAALAPKPTKPPKPPTKSSGGRGAKSLDSVDMISELPPGTLLVKFLDSILSKQHIEEKDLDNAVKKLR